jgi:hypothetical protein
LTFCKAYAYMYVSTFKKANTKMSVPTAEAFAPQQERKTGSERLTQEQMRQEFARIAVLALLITSMGSRETDHLFVQHPEQATQDHLAEDETPHADSGEILGLVDYSLHHNNEPQAEDYPDMSPGTWAGINAYRRDALTSTFRGTPNPGPVPDVTPAPTMSAQPLGPQLPNLPFNDRVRPQGAQPSTEQFAAADRANELYTKELLKQGWTGGEATPDQAKKAGRAMQFQHHPDRGASAADADALKAFNSQNAKPTTPGEKAPEPPTPPAPTVPAPSPMPSSGDAASSS